MASSPAVSNAGRRVPARIALVLALELTTGSRLLPLFATSSRQTGQAAQLKIVVIDGEGAVNIIRQKTGVPPVVEVRDRNDLPVSGALVTFTIGGGQNATFGGTLQTLTVTTNAAGRAAAAGLTPTSTGVVQINVAAAFQGQTAAATIAQTNFVTAAQAAQAAGASAGGGGGLSGGAIAGIGAAVAGGAVVAVKATGRKPDQNHPPEVCQSFVAQFAGLQGATAITFTALGCDDENDPLTYLWEFGDGSSSTAPNTSHVYASAGIFRPTITVSDGQSASAPQTFTVTIKSMTGRWTLGTTTNFFDLVQSGTNITGTFTVLPPFGGSGTVSGTVQTASPNVTFTLTQVAGANTTTSTFTGDPDANVNIVSGVLNGGGGSFQNTPAGLTRQ